ncbi:hypothetical protein BKA58DRAFT_420740 [Alternaria rosae]|uniref:uncharacterized protein n=1 Tax=Alternaria rosae TaxID=1187941 RepID=UPI001E8D9BD1|nr:uncharacterized protein BKA58DRAFT_420740 [Alternaria rosae]KAH6870120.1 hypothetical protein BKA58DRAFT_420740 [Alternaria rosae]
MKSLFFFLSLLPSSLALVAPLKRLTPDIRPRNAHWGTKSWSGTNTITVTSTLTVTVTVTAFPTANGTFPNVTTTDVSGPATSSDDLAPITLITLPTGVAATTGSSEGLAPVTLITLPTATDGGDGAAAPTPNDLEPVTLIDISTVTPI